MIQTHLKEFMAKWPREKARLKSELAKNKSFNAKLPSGDTSSKRTTTIKSSEVYERLVKALPKEFTSRLPELSKYKLKGSMSQGEVSDVPWLCIFDPEITTGAQHGYYPVYLFNADMKGVYLSLNQGWVQYENNYGISNGLVEIRNNAEQVAQSLSDLKGFDRTPITLESARPLARGYELGNICGKFYPIEDIPSDDVLLQDLKNVLNIYEEIKAIVGTNILKIGELNPGEFENQYQNSINNITPISLPKGPIKKPAKSERATSTGTRWNRNSSIAATALFEKAYTCENNSAHVTFIGTKGHAFMEAHHLIPMEFQGDFNVSIDVPENILCLCPTCHRSFHNSEIKLRKELLSRFFKTANTGLKGRGINITKNQLLKYYIK